MDKVIHDKELSRQEIEEMRMFNEKARREEERLKLYYNIEFKCLNCFWMGAVDIKRGSLITNQPCPNCGCTPAQIE